MSFCEYFSLMVVPVRGMIPVKKRFAALTARPKISWTRYKYLRMLVLLGTNQDSGRAQGALVLTR